MVLDTAVIGGTVVSEVGTSAVDLGIADGRVVAVVERGTTLDARRTIDVAGRLVLPGAIDTHTHLEWPWPDRAATDTFEAGSALAAIGGTTTIIDFVPNRTGESPRRLAEERVRRAEGRTFIDHAFHPILVSASRTVLDDIPGLVQDGFASFKIFTTYDGLRNDDRESWLLMRRIAESGGLAGFHAENDAMCVGAVGELVDQGHTRIRDYPLSRPQVAEAEAIGMVASYARILDSQAWIFHVSGADGLAAIAHARRSGLRVQAETCTHYIAFDDSVYQGPDPWRFVIAPPIRGVDHQAALWHAIGDGTLTAVGSDHGGYHRAQKQAGIEADDFRLLPQGATGIDARVPVVWSMGVADGRIDVTEFVTIMSGAPARALGLWPAKGSLGLGSDADLIVMDPDATWRFPAPVPGQGSDYSLYEDMPLRGRPLLTMVRGEVVAEQGRIVGSPGHGRFIPRTIDPALWGSEPIGSTGSSTFAAREGGG